ncbi:uncharacterized protein [Narcine bancroftii]|uniref:uncharacterized protein n=1 Tax=Narcine bancroftii TaxID=1343680 RepID=UPI00383114FE
MSPVMEKLLCPDRLEVDPQVPNASEFFEQWISCLNNFLEAAAVVVDLEEKRLKVLQARIAQRAFQAIRSCVNYTKTMAELWVLYKPKINAVYSRYLLASRKQQPGELVEEFVRALITLFGEPHGPCARGSVRGRPGPGCLRVRVEVGLYLTMSPRGGTTTAETDDPTGQDFRLGPAPRGVDCGQKRAYPVCAAVRATILRVGVGDG